MATLNKDDFGTANLVEPTSQYVGDNLAVLQGASAAAEQAYQRERSNFNKVDLAVDNVSALGADQALLGTETQGFKDTLNRIQEVGRFETAGTEIDNAARSFATNKKVQRIQANEAKSREVRNAINANKNYRTQDERNAAIYLADQRYKGVQVDADTGNVFGDYDGYQVSDRADVATRIDKLNTGWKADAESTSGVQFDKDGQLVKDANGNILTIANTVAGVSEAQLRKSMKASIQADPEIQASINQDFELANAKNEDYFTQGHLNDVGIAAQKEYRDQRLGIEIDKAAEKFGFVSTNTQIGLQQDKGAAANRKAKLAGKITSSVDRTTVALGDDYKPTEHDQVIKDSKKIIGDLERLRDSGSDEWSYLSAGQLEQAKKDMETEEIKYNNVKSTFTQSPEGKALIKEVADGWNIDVDSDAMEAAINGDYDPIARLVTNGKFSFSEWFDDSVNRGNDLIKPASMIEAFNRIVDLKGNLEDGAQTFLESKQISHDANAITIRDAAGKDVITESLTENVSVNPSAYLIKDEKGKSIPLDQYEKEEGTYEGYKRTVKLLESDINGEQAYLITWTPKEGKDANDLEVKSSILYPGKGSEDMGRIHNEMLITKALESSGDRVAGDRGKVDTTLDIDQDRPNMSFEDKRVYKIGQRKEASRIYKQHFKGLQHEWEQNKHFTQGEFTTTIPVKGSAGLVSVRVVKAKDESGFVRLNVYDTKTGKKMMRTPKASINDMMVELYKNYQK